MAYEVTIQYAEKIADLTLNGTVKKGDVLARNGTNWVQADASDAATNLFGQYIAMQSGLSGAVIGGCKGCVLYDADAPYTAGATHYVSGTAGAITATRPATAADVIQAIGEGIDTSNLRVDILAPREIEVFIPVGVYNDLGASIEAHIVDGTTNEWVGPDADSAAVAAVFTGRFPSGMIGAPLAADLIVDTQASTALNIDVTYVAAADGAANTGDAGATQTELTSATTTADNKIHKVSIVAGMDADFAKAGYNFGVAIDPDAGDCIVLGLYMRYKVV